jgi:hypothetical protein
MNNNTIKKGGRIYLPFYFDEELITPEQYLYWQQLKDEEMYQQYIEEYEGELCKL